VGGRAFLGLALLLALALRLPHLTESLWYDELFATDRFLGTGLGLAKTLLTDIHPPVYPLLMHAWDRVFGDSELSVRLPSLLAGLGSLPLLLAIGRATVGEHTARLATLLLAASPVHAWYSQEARHYSLVVLFFLAAILAFLRLCEAGERSASSDRRWLLLLAIGLFGAAFTHYYMAAMAPVIAVLAWWLGARRRRAITAIAACLVLAFAAFLAAKGTLSSVPTGMSYLRGFGPAEAWHLVTGWLVTGNAFAPRLAGGFAPPGLAALLELFAAGLLVAGVVVSLRPPAQRCRVLALLLLALVLPVSLFTLNLLGFERTYIERSALPCLPLVLLLLAAGLGRLGPRAGHVMLVVLMATAWLGNTLNREHWTIYKVNPDWRGAAAALGARLDAGDSPASLYSLYNSPTALSYYDPRLQESKFFEPNEQRMARLRDRLASGMASVLGEDSGLADALLAEVDTAFASYDEALDVRRHSMQLEILDHRRERPEARGEQRFWLLVHGEHGLPGEVAAEGGDFLEPGSGLVVREELRFRSLGLYLVAPED